MNYLKTLGLAVLVTVSPLISKAQHPDSVKVYIKQLRFKHPDLIYLIWAQESGYGASNLARRYNNPLGLKTAKKRGSVSIGETGSGFAIYRHWKDAFVDLKIYQLRYLKGKTRQETLDYLRRIYSLDKNYLKKFLGE